MSREKIWQFNSNSEAETTRLGHAIATVLKPQDVIALVGDLGTGKTRLVQAIAEGLGVDREDVNSPTFVLIQHYDGRLTLHHLDVYRLRDEDEFLDLGVDELFDGDGATLVEWADKVSDAIPEEALWVHGLVTGQDSRQFDFSGSYRGCELAVEIQRIIDSEERITSTS